MKGEALWPGKSDVDQLYLIRSSILIVTLCMNGIWISSVVVDPFTTSYFSVISACLPLIDRKNLGDLIPRHMQIFKVRPPLQISHGWQHFLNISQQVSICRLEFSANFRPLNKKITENVKVCILLKTVKVSIFKLFKIIFNTSGGCCVFNEVIF